MEDPETEEDSTFCLDLPQIPDFKAMSRKQALHRLGEAGRADTAKLRQKFLASRKEPRCDQTLKEQFNINTQAQEITNETVGLCRARDISPFCQSQKAATFPNLKEGLIKRKTMVRLPFYVAVQAETKEAFLYPEKKYTSSVSCFSTINKHGESDSSKQRHQEESTLKPVERVDQPSDIFNRKLSNVLFRKSANFKDVRSSGRSITPVTKTLESINSNKDAVTKQKVRFINEETNRAGETPKALNNTDTTRRDKAHFPVLSNTLDHHQRRNASAGMKSSLQCFKKSRIPSYACLKQDNTNMCKDPKLSLLNCQDDYGCIRPHSELLTRSKSDLTRYIYKRYRNYFIHPEWFSEEIGWQRHFHESTPEQFRYAWM